ncbi:MAG: hypothetical protein ACR2OZ_06215 [Verrucomicrobiales bacterium]
MKRLLSFIPAVVAGLLAGWAVSAWIIPRFGSAGVDLQNTVPAEPKLQPLLTTRAAWQKLLEARTPLPSPPQDVMAWIERENAIKKDHVRSPVRLTLLQESLRHTLPDPLITSGYQGGAGAGEAFARLAKKNPCGALSTADRMMWDGSRCDSQQIDGFRRIVLREWLRQDPQAALAEVTGHATSQNLDISNFDVGSKLRLLMQEWSRLDPAAAAVALKSLPEIGPGFEMKDFAHSLFEIWNGSDPASARQWAETQADPALRESLNTLAEELAAKDPAAKAAVLLAAPQRDGHKLATALGEWLAAEPVAAMEKLSAIPADDKFWAHDAAHAAERWAIDARSTMTPEQFLETIRSVPAGPQREAILKGLTDYGTSNDIPFAVRMVAEMGEGEVRSEAMSGLTERWMRKDPVQLSEWLAAQPAGEARQGAVSRFAELLAKSDPEAAARWADTIPDSYRQKENVVRTVREKWQVSDPDAAAAWRPQ